MTSGVPQGSILGPLLFSIALNSSSKLSLSKHAVLSMFADDMALYRPIFNNEDTLALQCDVALLADWVESEGLKLNIDKTKTMLISRKKVKPALNIWVNGSKIEVVTTFRYLGVNISDDLSWQPHINYLCSRAKQRLGFIYRTFTQANVQCLAHLYKSLVKPLLEYCSAVWDPHQVTLIGKLERVQGFAAKLATRCWSSHGQEVVSKLGWPKLAARRAYHKICICRRILKGHSIIPPDVFTPHPYTGSLRHHNSIQLYKPLVKTNYHRAAYFISVVSLWNRVPEYITAMPTELTFKKHLKNFLVV